MCDGHAVVAGLHSVVFYGAAQLFDFRGITLASMLTDGVPLENRLEFGLTLGIGIFIWRLVTFEPPKPTHFRLGCHRHTCKLGSTRPASAAGGAAGSGGIGHNSQVHPHHQHPLLQGTTGLLVGGHRAGEFVNGPAVDTRSMLSSGEIPSLSQPSRKQEND